MHELAVGRGIFIWLIFRSLAHAIGWPATMALVVVMVVGVGLARARRSR